MSTIDKAYDFKMCWECYYAVANGADELDITEEERDLILSQVPDAVLHLTNGWPREWQELGGPDDEDSFGFYWRHECDGCGSTLGGDRYAVTGWVD